MEEFNAHEGLKDFDPTIDKNYCGPGKEYVIGSKFEALESEVKNQFMKETSFRIGQMVKTNIHIGEADPETKATKGRPIGEAEIIDIVCDIHKNWRLRLRYSICNNYKGNLWPHYTDVKIENCEKITEY
jgi:hypothetical protein